ncbi:MAG TPA: zinc ribbon domain-containing protein [Actinomycetota bacterium]|nr:zinc ribbon domain-containing protein [Actinomycetota bacterium]
MKRAFALLGLFATSVVAWLALLPSQVMATVEGGCTASIGGENVTRGHDSADTAVPLESGDRVRVAGTAPERIGDLSYTVHVAGGGVQVGRVTIAQDGLSWRGSVDLENISNATVGLFEITAEVQNVAGEEICTGVTFVCIEGRSPFTTAAGATATALGVGGGILLVLALVRAPGMGAARTGIQGFAGGAAGGLAGAVLLQQFCVVPLTAGTAAGIPVAAGAAGAIGALVLRTSGTTEARRTAQLADGLGGDGGGGHAGEPTGALERAGAGSGSGTGGHGPAPGSPVPPPPAGGGVIVPPVVPPRADEEQICASCGTANSPDGQFCTNCGSRLGS